MRSRGISSRRRRPPSSVAFEIRAQVQKGLYSRALQSYSTPEARLLLLADPTSKKFVFPPLLKACAALSDPRHGKALHSHIFAAGLHYDPYIASSLITFYLRCGSYPCALKVFVEMSERGDARPDVALHNSMLDGYFQYGRYREGVLHFRRMQFAEIEPDGYSLCIMLGACKEGRLGHRPGKQIHAYIVGNALLRDPYLVTALINMYSGGGEPSCARLVFHHLADKNNAVAWNALMSGLCDNGFWGESLELFFAARSESCRLDRATFACALTACCHAGNADLAWQIHGDVVKAGFRDDYRVCTSLVTAYAKCGMVGSARGVFDWAPRERVEVWNAMISGYAAADCVDDALCIYNQMRFSDVEIDSSAASNVLSCCAAAGFHGFGRAVHGELIKRSIHCCVSVQSVLLTMYSKCGQIEDAASGFSMMEESDVVAWGSMISGYCQSGDFIKALNLFRAMVGGGIEPDSMIMASVISSCTGLESMKLGGSVHGYAVKVGLVWDVFVASSLVDMYSKCGSASLARAVFFSMPHRNLVAWNSMMSCYCRNGLPELSIALFPQMAQHGMYPGSESITILLSAVSLVAALSKGKAVHSCQIKRQVPSNLQVENALLDMYFKCGSLQYARKMFDAMPHKNLSTWNSMISGYGSHGKCSKALQLFDKMTSSEVVPDGVTFLSLISSCSHSGLVEGGLNLFRMMRDYVVEPWMQHYAVVVDLLSRAGHLEDACDFIRAMPMEPDRAVWLCFLGSCHMRGNKELGELATQNLLRMEPTRGSNYVPLLNLRSAAGSWDKMADIRLMMKDRGLKKNPGCSWIEADNRVVKFFSGDSSSQRIVEIHETLRSLQQNMDA